MSFLLSHVVDIECSNTEELLHVLQALVPGSRSVKFEMNETKRIFVIQVACCTPDEANQTLEKAKRARRVSVCPSL